MWRLDRGFNLSECDWEVEMGVNLDGVEMGKQVSGENFREGSLLLWRRCSALGIITVDGEDNFSIWWSDMGSVKGYCSHGLNFKIKNGDLEVIVK